MMIHTFVLLLLLDVDFDWLFVVVRFDDGLSLVTINLPANPSLNEDDCCCCCCCWLLLFDVLRLIACSFGCFIDDDCCCCCDDFDFDDNFCDCNDDGDIVLSKYKRWEYLHNVSPIIPSPKYLAKQS